MSHRRSLRELHGTPRSAPRSLWRTHREAAPPPETAPPARRVRQRVALLTRTFFVWLWNYLKYALRPRCRFATYAPGTLSPGIYAMDDPYVVALAADWGSGTDSAYRVAQLIAGHRPKPDCTIHMGDVYYSGTEREFREYFLPPDAWPRGARRTFALNGNHEMYSGGEGYFGAALPALGQDASYFCLENAHWRVVALDTGYYAKTLPLLELFDTNLIKLHRDIRAWLRDVIFSDSADRRPVVLLSHHNWFSAFDREYRRIGRQLGPYLDRVVLWIWGHEHRFAGYAPFGFDGVTVRGRCIGHGGMPIELGKAPRRERQLVFSDEREDTRATAEVGAKGKFGYCGFAMLRFEGRTLTVRYLDDIGNELLEERWTVDASGTARGSVSGGAELTRFRPLETLVS
jgi:Calcineurin-like phosphoesterase